MALVMVAAAAGVPAQDMGATVVDLNPPVLKINDTTVYAAEVSMVMANIAGQLKLQGREAPDQQQLVQMATQRVVEQKLLSQEARRLGYRPNELRIAEMAKEVENQAGSREALDESLASKGTDYNDLMATLEEMDLVRTLIDKQLAPKISVSEEDVLTFYNENQEIFSTPEQVHARHIIFAANERATADQIISARNNADEARKRALAGEDFAELARELSEGPSAPKGGDLGFFTYQQMVPPFAEAAFALDAGEISEVVRTNFGFHVIKVEEKKAAVVKPLEEVSGQARQILIQQNIAAEVQVMLKTLGEAATIVPLADGQEAPEAADEAGAG
jgi:peptidyl-prolyl cis-trans isomerase C